MYRALAVALLAALLVAGTTYRRGMSTAEDSVVLTFVDNPPVKTSHIGVVAPHPGTMNFLYVTGNVPGTGQGTAIYAAVRLDGGVLCSIEVPCTLDDGEHAPSDGGVALCDTSVSGVGYLEHVDFEPIVSDCSTQPEFFMQATFFVE